MLPAWDIATGLHAAVGLLAAERARTRTGVGQFVSVSLADVAFAMVANLGYLAQAQVLGEARPPIGNDMYGAFGRDFPTADGRRVMVVAISLRQWQSLVEAVEIGEHLPAIERAFRVDLSQEGDRFRARDALAALIAPWVAERTLAEIARVFDTQRRVLGRLPDVRAAARRRLAGVADSQPGVPRHRPAGPRQGARRRLAAGVLRPSTATTRARRRTLGEHTEQILADELGLSSAEIARLRDAGVVAGPA